MYYLKKRNKTKTLFKKEFNPNSLMMPNLDFGYVFFLYIFIFLSSFLPSFPSDQVSKILALSFLVE